MSIVTDCFDNIIGITQSDCDCFGTIADIESESGLYLDELTGLEDVFSIISCQEGSDVSKIVERSLYEAKTDFIGDFNGNILSKYKVKRMPFSGVIGRPTFKTSIPVTIGHYAGVKMFCADVVSGNFTISKIGTVFESTGNVEVHITNNLNEYIGSYTLPTLANRHSVSNVSLTLPLHSPYTENLEYYFFYSVDQSNKPKNNEVKCGTCGSFKPRYDTTRPYFNTQTGGQYGWANWMMAGGMYIPEVTGDPTTEDFSCQNTIGENNMYGLTFEVTINCAANEVICKNGFDFQTDPIAMAVAMAIRFRAGAIIYEKIIRSGIINRMTMMNRDEKKDLIQYYNERYMTFINYIIDNLRFSANDCYSCKERFEMGVAHIKR